MQSNTLEAHNVFPTLQFPSSVPEDIIS